MHLRTHHDVVPLHPTCDSALSNRCSIHLYVSFYFRFQEENGYSLTFFYKNRVVMFALCSSLCAVPAVCKDVQQSPDSVLCHPDSIVELTCSHDIKSYDTILWYQRSAGDTELKLLAYMYYKTPKTEDPYVNVFNVSGDGEKASSLHIPCKREAKVTAMYYCAASITQCCEI